MTGNATCATTTNAVISNILNINISSSVSPAVSIAITDSNICSGATATFTATPINGGATPAYQWQVNGVNIGSNNPIFTSNTLINNSQVKVIMTSSLACASPATTNSNSINMRINSSVTPTISITASATSICSGAQATFTATATNGGTAPSYQWKRNNINVGSNSAVYLTNTLANGDVITVTLTSNAPCVTSASIVSNSITMGVNSGPSTITISGDTTVNTGSPATIISTIANINSTPTYQWQDSTQNHTWTNIIGATNANISYLPMATGNKIRCLLSNASTCNIVPVVSNVLKFTVNQPTNGGRVIAVNYHPNPATTTLTIDSLQLSDGWETLTIIGIYGGSGLITKNINGQTHVQVRVDMLPPGTYIAVLRRSGNGPTLFKFIKL
jgi:hypothetical protein